MYYIMDTLPPSEFNELAGDRDHVIMSDGLELDLGETLTVDQILDINDTRLICSILRVKSMRLNDDSCVLWEFELEVPGLSFSDLVNATDVIFHYGDASFKSTTSLELKTQQLVNSPVLIFVARRIFNNNE
jgi:hypothetical protein